MKETCQNLVNVNTLIVETIKTLLANNLSKNYFNRIHFNLFAIKIHSKTELKLW